MKQINKYQSKPETSRFYDLRVKNSRFSFLSPYFSSEMIYNFIEQRFKIFLLFVRRVFRPLSLLMFVFLGGSGGFWILGKLYNKDWSISDCTFMTAITLTTVGYGDHLGASQFLTGRIYIMFLIISGMGATLYSVSALTAFIVEGNIGSVFREVNMTHAIENLKNHTIICGAGTTGHHVLTEHVSAGTKFVVIERNIETIQHINQLFGEIRVINGDAVDEEILFRSGIKRAKQLIAVLGDEKENLFLVVTARYLNPNIEIIAKCIEHDSAGKFKAAGASHVISPTYIGGMRIASQSIRPHVVDFLDEMLKSNGEVRVSECKILKGSSLAGKKIAESRIGDKVGLLIVAMKGENEESFVFSPPSHTLLTAGTTIVVIGPQDKVRILEEMSHP